MEEKCIPSADIDSIGCHLNEYTRTATNTTTGSSVLIDDEEPTTTATTAASYFRSLQMSTSKDQLFHQQHKSNVQSINFKHNKQGDNDDGRGCSLSMPTPATNDNSITLHYKDDDSRSGSSDDITTPIVDLHHMHQRQQRNHDDDSTPTSSTHTIEVIKAQDHDNTGSVEIYLETPVIDDQMIGLNSHDYENAKPKRLSDEFLKSSSEDSNEEERNASSESNRLTTISSMNSNKCAASFQMDSSEIQSHGEQINEMLSNESESGNDKDVVNDGQSASGYCDESHERPTKNDVIAANNDESDTSGRGFSFKSIGFPTTTFNGGGLVEREAADDDGLMMEAEAPRVEENVAENDVQSMDAIERRDFEDEQRLTGGIIIKSSSLAKNNRLILDLVQPNAQNANNVRQRAVSSDSKCTYKEHSSTPTSSRHCSNRLTKSTAKINLTTSLSHHPEATINGDVQQCIDSRNTVQQSDELMDPSLTNTLHHKVQEADDEPGPSRLALAASVSAKSTSSKTPAAAADDDGPANARRSFELFSNSNSNDSLASDHSYSTSSSHSLSHLAKQQQQQQQPGCSGTSSASSLNPDDELKKSPAHVEIKSECVDEEVVPTTSTSARCHYASALRYIRSTQRKVVPNSLNRVDAAVPNIIDEPMIAATSTLYAMSRVINSNYPMSQQELHQDAARGEENHGNGDLANLRERDMRENEFDDENWAECDDGSDEEVCTCQKDNYMPHVKREMSDAMSDDGTSKDVELSSYIQMVSISEDNATAMEQNTSPESTGLQRKRKLNDSRLLDSDPMGLGDSSGSGRKRIAYDYSSTPRSSQSLGRRTPRALIPTRDNPPPELQNWLLQFQRWSHVERLLAVDRLIEYCEPTQVRHMMKVIEPQFQRDFISLLPRELALQVLAYLEPQDLLRAAQTCRSWRFLCDDNLLWKEKCRKEQILTEPKTDRPKRGRAGNMPPIASPWKAAYMRQHIIELNWRTRPVREPKVLKGHDDHVITCLQFSGNRIVSGSDDNTLKVWSAVTGRCLRTLIGHTGGVWSSQMSGNTIISGSTDRTLKVWDMETGHCMHTLMGHTSTVRCMHLHGKKVVSGSRDATLRVWDIERGVCLHVLVGHLAAVRCVQYDGKLIVSGAYDYMVKIWHPERQECLHTLQGHTNRVYSLQFDGIHVVSGSLDTSIRVWDVETGNCKHTLMGHQSLTSGMELRQNILVSGNADSTVKVWDITNGQCLQTLSGPNKHQSAVTCLQFNSRFVITSSDDGTVKLWDVKTGEFIRNLVTLESGGSGGVVWRIRANDTKLICAVGSRNGTEETKLMVLDFDVEGACVKCS